MEIANNGEEAISKCQTFNPKPDLIIMDHRMPIKNGLEATKEILKLDKSARIIFASADKSIKSEALSTGALMFKEKPFSISDLLDSIEKSLKF